MSLYIKACLDECTLDDVDCDDSETASADDEETYSWSCDWSMPGDCIGQPCKEGEVDSRSSSIYTLTCVNGVWEGEYSYPDYGSIPEPSEGSTGPVFGEACDNEGQIEDYEYSNYNKVDSNGRTCYITHWICENGVWDPAAQCSTPGGSSDDYTDNTISASFDTEDSSTISADDEETYSFVECSWSNASECVGKPCKEGDVDSRGDSSNLILTCVNGVWEGDWEYEGSMETSEPSEDDNTISTSFDTEDSSTISQDSGSNSPAYGQPCDVEGETVDIEGSSSYQSSVRNQKWDCIATHYVCINGLWDIHNVCEVFSADDWSTDVTPDDNGSSTIETSEPSGSAGPEDNGSNDPVYDEPCDVEGETIDIEDGSYRNSVRDQKWDWINCHASHWICSNGLWDIMNVCESTDFSSDISIDDSGSLTWQGDGPPPWADENGCVNGYKWYCDGNSECAPCDYDSSDDDISNSNEDCEYGTRECVGKPCNQNRKTPEPKDSGETYICVDGIWELGWDFESESWSGGETYLTDDAETFTDLNEYTTDQICFELCSRKFADDSDAELQACIDRCLGPLVFDNHAEGSASGSSDDSETGSEGTVYITHSYDLTEICDGSYCVGQPCDESFWRNGDQREHSGEWVYSCVDGVWVDDYEWYGTSDDNEDNELTTTAPFVTTLTPIATTTSDFATTTIAPSACDEERTYECPDNSFCVPADNFVTFTCQCKSGYFMSGNMCHKKTAEAESCPTDFKKDLFKMNLDGLRNPMFYLNKGSVMIQVESQVVSRFRCGLILYLNYIIFSLH